MKKGYTAKTGKAFGSFSVINVLLLIFSISFSSKVLAQPCITVYPHVEGFELAPTWTAVTAPTSSVAGTSDWAWGTPNHTYVIHSAGTGSKSWSGGGLTGAFYNYNQQSYIYSPCYNFTTLQYPFIQFQLFYDLELTYDGSNLQSSINGGTTWQDVGAYLDPPDCNTAYWYNKNNIKYLNLPAGFVTSKVGWCGNMEAGGVGWDPGHAGTNCVGGGGIGHWVTAKHCLTGLAGQPNVIFRFTLGAGYSCNDFDGIAIDSVSIGNGTINTTTLTSTCAANTITFSSGAKACPTTTWAWTFGDGNTSTAQNPTHTYAPGIYTVSVIASGGACNPPDTATQVIHVLGVSITSFTNASCATQGAATALAANGTAPTYSWSNGATTATTTGLNAGTYTVTVSDPSTTCPTMTTVTITQPNPIVITLSSTPASCAGNNGTATATSVTGGNAPYTYSWSPVGGTGTTASNLAAGIYSLTITDASTCTATQTVQVTNSSGPLVTVSSTSVSCNGGNNGSGTATVTGGTAPITYSWSPMGGTGATASNLPQGTYTIVVTDASPCSVTNIITITQPTAIHTVTSSTAATCGQSNGMASIIVTGGTPGYTYNWSATGGNTANATGLGLGTYTINGIDANACTYSTTVTVIQQSAVNVAVVSTPASCGNNNGTATATATGGFPAVTGYTYTWSPVGGNTNTAVNLAPSGVTYSIIVGDSLGCTTTRTVNVANNPSPVLTVTSTSITCNGLINGSAACTINAGTGTGPFTYTWSPAGGNGATATSLGTGTYTVHVTDVVTCTATAVVTINQPPALTATATATPATCGNANGSTTCTAGGGVSPYTYAWSPSGGNNITAANLAGNTTYTVTVTDANNCVQTANVLVGGTPAVTLSVPTTTNVSCNGGNDGAVSVTAGGGTAPINYVWIPTGGTNPIATGLSAAIGGTTYTVVATDNIGCTAMVVATITEPTPVTVNVTGITICLGQSANIFATASGGNGGYTYTWTPTGSNAQTINVSPVTTTNYSVAVQDIKGCTGSANGTVTVLTPLLITVSTNDTVCPGKSAQLYVTAESGGLGLGHYSVTWLPTGTLGDTLTVVPNSTTTYTAILSDGCTVATATTTGTVYLYPIPLISYTATPIAGCAPLKANFSAAGVNNIVANSWYWNFGDGTSSSAPNGISHTYMTTGIYYPVLYGTTTNGCKDSSGVVDTIQVYPQPQAGFTASSYTTDLNNNTIHFYNQSSPTSASQTVSPTWTFIGQNVVSDEQNPTYTFFPEGTYSVTLYVINQYGCKDSVTEVIVIQPDFTFYAPNCVTPNGDGLNEKFLPEGTGWDMNQYDLWIFDRWGLMFHHTQDPYGGWDGTKNNHDVQEDTYVWKVNLHDVFGNAHTYHGTVTVVR